MTEFNLSEEVWYSPINEGYFYPSESVKEFIRLLKEALFKIDNGNQACHIRNCNVINKLAGADLTEDKLIPITKDDLQGNMK